MGKRLTFKEAYEFVLGEEISPNTKKMISTNQPIILDDFILFENKMIFRIFSYVNNFVDFFKEYDLGIIEISCKHEKYNIYYILMSEFQLKKLHCMINYIDFEL